MKNRYLTCALAAAFAAAGLTTSNAATVLTFEGLADGEPVLEYYNGGLGGLGSGPGANYGISFSNNALAVIDVDAGGNGNFGGEPSPSTVLYFLTGSAILTYASGFDTGFSFYYSAIGSPGVVNVFDGLNGTGNLLASINLPVTPSDGGDPNGAFSPFYPIGVSFQGTALSVDFGGTVNQIGFDNITFGSSVPEVNPIPEPGSVVALGCVLASGLLLRSRRSKA